MISSIFSLSPFGLVSTTRHLFKDSFSIFLPDKVIDLLCYLEIINGENLIAKVGIILPGCIQQYHIVKTIGSLAKLTSSRF